MSEQDDDKFGMYGSKKAAAKWDWDQVVRGLGMVSIEFQLLETVIKIAIGELVRKDDPKMGFFLTADLPFRTLLDLLYAAFEYDKQDLSPARELNKILERCAKAADRRNQLVHSYWHQESQDGKYVITRVKFTARNRKGYRLKSETITSAVMEKVASELRRCKVELYDFLASNLPGFEPIKP